MGKSLDEITNGLPEGRRVGITIVTNQDTNSIVGYATGELVYHPATLVLGTPFLRPARLSTTGGDPLKFYFSDRRIAIDPTQPEGRFGLDLRQPFSANATDMLGVSVSLGIGPRTMKLTFLSWGGGTFSVVTEARGNLLVGLGPSLGNSSSAVYVASFSEVPPGPK